LAISLISRKRYRKQSNLADQVAGLRQGKFDSWGVFVLAL